MGRGGQEPRFPGRSRSGLRARGPRGSCTSDPGPGPSGSFRPFCLQIVTKSPAVRGERGELRSARWPAAFNRFPSDTRPQTCWRAERLSYGRVGGSGAPQRLPADAPAPARLSGTFVRCAVTRGELLLPRRLAPGGFALCQFCPEDLLYSVAHPQAAGHCPVSCGPPWNDELSLLDPAREFEPGLSLITGGIGVFQKWRWAATVCHQVTREW